MAVDPALAWLVAQYEAMASAARAQAWERLLVLGAGVTPWRPPPPEVGNEPADAAARAAQGEHFRRLQALEREIRDAIHARQAQLRQRLARVRAVRKAYGACGGRAS